jgi:para-aminobenzoate synthetase component 2
MNPDKCDLLVVSAGPGHPSEYTKYSKLLDSDVSVLGICLGMQVINEHFGGTTVRLEGCVHGRSDVIIFDGRSFEVATYNSLRVDHVGEDLEVIARNSKGVPMALRHRTRRIIGYQFHPESFLTADGGYFVEYAINFLEMLRPTALPEGSL